MVVSGLFSHNRAIFFCFCYVSRAKGRQTMKTKGADLIFSLFSGAECQQDLRGREIAFENVASRVNSCDVIKNHTHTHPSPYTYVPRWICLFSKHPNMTHEKNILQTNMRIIKISVREFFFTPVDGTKTVLHTCLTTRIPNFIQNDPVGSSWGYSMQTNKQ